eukprot:TRINITY_DN4028_c0_g1_i1.p1 TRINITY_DN4028_c0_g1~~TRINITY_DN4028_c0_g1_i1.p1  ORF type:complete len:121 (+),score=11.52 TRINITY_DN4028_c0_g1_i1:172-534(+)
MMNKNDLQELGVDKLGHRLRIHKEIEKLKQKVNLTESPPASKSNLADLYIRGITTWTTIEVTSWLSDLGISDYNSVLTKARISGLKLTKCTKSDLQSLGITKLGHRLRILKSVKMLMRNR